MQEYSNTKQGSYLHVVDAVASAGEALGLDLIKSHMRLEEGFTADDQILRSLRQAAVTHTENLIGRPLLAQTKTLYMQNWPAGEHINLPWSPVTNVTSSTSISDGSSGAAVAYKESDRTWTALSSTNWVLDVTLDPSRVSLEYDASWPSATLHNVSPIRINYACGYSTVSSGIPGPIRTALLLMIGNWYENREQVVLQSGLHAAVVVPKGVRYLLEQYKTRWTI